MATSLLAVRTLSQVRERREQRKAAKRARLAEEKRVAAENLKATRLAVAERVRRAAQVTAAGQAAGIGAGSTPIVAEVGSLSSQLGSNIGFAQQVQNLEQQRTSALARISESQGRSADISAFTDFVGAFQRGYGG